MDVYDNRQVALERIRAEVDELALALWNSYYEGLSFQEVDQLLNGRNLSNHSVIDRQSPESYAAARVWRDKSAHLRPAYHGRVADPKTLNVDGATPDNWRSRPRE